MTFLNTMQPRHHQRVDSAITSYEFPGTAAAADFGLRQRSGSPTPYMPASARLGPRRNPPSSSAASTVQQLRFPKTRDRPHMPRQPTLHPPSLLFLSHHNHSKHKPFHLLYSLMLHHTDHLSPFTHARPAASPPQQPQAPHPGGARDPSMSRSRSLSRRRRSSRNRHGGPVILRPAPESRRTARRDRSHDRRRGHTTRSRGRERRERHPHHSRRRDSRRRVPDESHRQPRQLHHNPVLVICGQDESRRQPPGQTHGSRHTRGSRPTRTQHGDGRAAIADSRTLAPSPAPLPAPHTSLTPKLPPGRHQNTPRMEPSHSGCHAGPTLVEILNQQESRTPAPGTSWSTRPWAPASTSTARTSSRLSTPAHNARDRHPLALPRRPPVRQRGALQAHGTTRAGVAGILKD